jgi:hypothetical protein
MALKGSSGDKPPKRPEASCDQPLGSIDFSAPACPLPGDILHPRSNVREPDGHSWRSEQESSADQPYNGGRISAVAQSFRRPAAVAARKPAAEPLPAGEAAVPPAAGRTTPSQ